MMGLHFTMLVMVKQGERDRPFLLMTLYNLGAACSINNFSKGTFLL